MWMINRLAKFMKLEVHPRFSTGAITLEKRQNLKRESDEMYQDY
jgi:hypothetical protein